MARMPKQPAADQTPCEPMLCSECAALIARATVERARVSRVVARYCSRKCRERAKQRRYWARKLAQGM